ncbi:MAG: DUF4013 domain-containing protein [Candidatus Latescibacterota bacterium]|nr:DUF4013 domain-containing protein [Candidatus Latescibacterota bacterium]
MNFAVILFAALRALFQDPDWWKKILIGGLLTPIPVCLIVFGGLPQLVGIPLVVVANFVIWGYTYRVFIDALNGPRELLLASWTDWRAYFRVGFWIFLITLGYVVLAAFGIVAAISLIEGGVSSDLQSMTLIVLGSVALFNTISPIVFTRFAEEGRVWACFEPDAIWRDARRVVRLDYVQLCFLFYCLWTMCLIVLGGLPQLVGIPLVSVSQFLLTLVFSHVFGTLIGLRKQPDLPVQDE